MLTEVKNLLNFIIMSLKYNLKSALEYKKSFIVQALFMVFNNLFFLIYWFVVFSINDGNLNGIVMRDVLLLWALPNGSWGFANFFFGGLREIDRLVVTGALDTYLLQPKNLILSIAVSKCRFSSFGDLIFGIGLACFASNSIIEYLSIIGFMILGAIIFMSCFIIVRSFSVWLGDMENITRVFEQSLLITLSTYPYNIFGSFIKVLMFTIVPAAYISHMPIKIIQSFDIKYFIAMLLVDIMYISVSIKLFYTVLKKYESGNNISMKD